MTRGRAVIPTFERHHVHSRELAGASRRAPPPASETAAAFNVDPMTWVLSGGDDHCLLATFPPETEIPGTFEVLGKVLPPSPECSVSVDGRAWVGEPGHEHFT